MAKLRKMLGDVNAPYIISIMGLIETQSKETLATWCMNYAEEHILPIYTSAYPDDTRLSDAIKAARECLEGKIKVAVAKKVIAEANVAAKEKEENPSAQAAARAVGQAAGVIYTPTHSLGMVFYGAAAIAYNRVGLNEKAEVYEQIAYEECTKMELALRAIAVENETKPAKINWNC